MPFFIELSTFIIFGIPLSSVVKIIPSEIVPHNFLGSKFSIKIPRFNRQSSDVLEGVSNDEGNSGGNGDTSWKRKSNNVSSFDGSKVVVKQEPLPELRKDLFQLFDIHELEKYMTPEELAKGGAW